MSKKRLKTPTILQSEVTECGAVALGIVMSFFGCHLPVQQLREDCGVSRDGCKASNIVKAARRYEFESDGYSINIENLKNTNVPCILFWKFNHFVVYEGYINDNFYINDPATGHRKVDYKEFNSSFTGVILTIKPTDKVKKYPKQKIFNNFITLNPNSKVLSFFIMTSLIITIIPFLYGGISKLFIDYYLIAKQTHIFITIILLYIVTNVINSFVSFVRNLVLIKIEYYIAIKNTISLFKHVLKLPLDFFIKRYTSDIADRIYSLSNISDTFIHSFISVISNVTFILASMIGMIMLNFTLSMISILYIMLLVIIISLFLRKNLDYSKKIARERGEFYSCVNNIIKNFEVIKVNNLKKLIMQRFLLKHMNNLNSITKINVLNNIEETIVSFINPISILIIFITGTYKVINGSISIGELIAFETLYFLLLNSSSEIINTIQNIYLTISEVIRLNDIITHNLEKNNKIITIKHTSYSKFNNIINIKHLSYNYNSLDEAFIKDFNLDVKIGEKIAIVGRSGSGKSTIAKIISGLITNYEGTIEFIYNRQIKIGYIDQNSYLFSDTLYNNLTMWDAQINQDIINNGLQTAHFECLNNSYGLFTRINRNGNALSGGEKQRIDIARVIINDPDIIIMDEATSALDDFTEKEIISGLFDKNKTIIIITHRLTSIVNVDKIIVMDLGKIVEVGSHNELLGLKGFYYSMFMEEYDVI